MLNKNIEFGTAVFCTVAFFLGLSIAILSNHKIEIKRKDEAKVAPVEKYEMHDLDYHTPEYDISKVV